MRDGATVKPWVGPAGPGWWAVVVVELEAAIVVEFEARAGGELQFITSKGSSKQRPDTNKTYLNQKDHADTSGHTGGHQD